jgi:iron(III) transport system ATP-binding protein
MLSVRRMSKTFVTQSGLVRAVRDISIVLEKGRRLALLGPSGCGKTTILRCIAGLESPDSGSMSLNGTCIFDSEAQVDIPPWKRSVGMVFQNFALWPHMSALSNVAFPLQNERYRVRRQERTERARAALAVVRMDQFADRYPAELSGGQRQRVALARSLVVTPGLLLMDEPLSSLDQALRKQTRDELVEILDREKVSTIVVTHDPLDAYSIAHEIALMDAGKIAQIGKPQDLYSNPGGLAVGRALGGGSVVLCSVDRQSDGSCRLTFPDSTQFLVLEAPVEAGKVEVLFRPNACVLASISGQSDGAGAVRGRIKAVTFAGEVSWCVVSVDGSLLEMPVPATYRLKTGDTVTVAIDTRRLHVFPLTSVAPLVS